MKPSCAFRAGALAVAALAAFTACSSTTVIRSNPPGARVFLDDQPVGVTPYAMSDSKIVGSSTRVRLEYPGMQPTFAVINRNEKFDALACLGGVLLLVPFLWIMKYNGEHYYDLTAGMGYRGSPMGVPPGPNPTPVGVAPNPNPTPVTASPDPVPVAVGAEAARADKLNEEGKALYKNRDYPGAVLKFREAISISGEGRFYYNLCAALDLSGDATGAIAACNEVYRLQPTPELKQKTDDRVKQIQARQPH